MHELYTKRTTPTLTPMHVCTHTHACTHTDTDTHTQTHTDTHTQTHTHTHTHTHTQAFSDYRLLQPQTFQHGLCWSCLFCLVFTNTSVYIIMCVQRQSPEVPEERLQETALSYHALLQGRQQVCACLPFSLSLSLSLSFCD